MGGFAAVRPPPSAFDDKTTWSLTTGERIKGNPPKSKVGEDAKGQVTSTVGECRQLKDIRHPALLCRPRFLQILQSPAGKDPTSVGGK